MQSIPKNKDTVSRLEAIRLLKKGEIGCLLTDTIYGLVATTRNQDTIKKLYRLRRRSKKAFPILIGSWQQLAEFSLAPDKETRKILMAIWPGPVTVVFPVSKNSLNYLHLGKKSLALRFPRKKSLQDLLRKTGPLVAPSANPPKKNPAMTIAQARKYFGKKIDFYVQGGKGSLRPSTIIVLDKEKYRVSILRSGRFSRSKLKRILPLPWKLS